VQKHGPAQLFSQFLLRQLIDVMPQAPLHQRHHPMLHRHRRKRVTELGSLGVRD
jgi:hypothetical protein